MNVISTAKDKRLLAAAAGAIWKCSLSSDNCTELHKLQAIEPLTKLLDNQPEEVNEFCSALCPQTIRLIDDMLSMNKGFHDCNFT